MIIAREIIQRLEAWKDDADRSPLIVQGARQIGKSWAVTEFGRTHYRHTAIFNFDTQHELRAVSEKTKDVRRLLSEMERNFAAKNRKL